MAHGYVENPHSHDSWTSVGRTAGDVTANAANDADVSPLIIKIKHGCRGPFHKILGDV